MDFFYEYLKEVEGTETLKFPFGFVTYEDRQDHLYASRFYVIPKERGHGKVPEMFESLLKVAKEKGYKTICGTVDLSSPTKTVSLLSQLKLGFEPYAAQNDVIWLKYEVL